MSEVGGEISQTEYSEFISQIDLQAVWLKDEAVSNRIGPRPGGHFTTNFRVLEATYEETNEGFRAFIGFEAEFLVDDQPPPGAEISALLALDYTSTAKISPRIFALFGENNVPVNAWPYFRALAGELTARMGWTPFTLPVFKILLEAPREVPEPAPTPRKRAARSQRGT